MTSQSADAQGWKREGLSRLEMGTTCERAYIRLPIDKVRARHGRANSSDGGLGDRVASDVIWKRLRRRWTAFPPSKRPRQAQPLAPLWSCAHPRYRSRPRTPFVKITDCGLFLYSFP